ncbi:MAG: SDR family oxidoreductase [Desulfobacterales bacterium]|nr:MAG: SDR family oxidoreductase [Desulfobacterales bacterium]
MSFLEEMFGLDGKTAIVAGGAGVIGTVMSKALLMAGANVVIWSRTQASIDQALEQLKALAQDPERMKGMQVDTAIEKEVAEALAASAAALGSPEILINAVGGNIGKAPFVETEMDQFELVLKLNLIAGLMVPTKVIAAYWIENKIKGSIINLTSMASYNPLSGVWAYDAAKSGVLNLTTGAANEFAAYGIRVNAIAPGFFLGKQNRALLVDQQTGEYTERGNAVIAHTPFGRFGNAEELMGATLFLASNQASGFVTGTSIPVDGGYLAHNI